MKRFLFITTLFALASTGCKKDSSEPALPLCRIVKIDGPSAFEYVLSHDVNGRLQSVVYSGGSTTNFTYNGNTITALTTGNNGYYQKSIYSINSNGLVSHEKREYDATGSVWQTRDYEYNGKQVTKQTLTKSAGNNSVRNFTWTNGNLITENIQGATFSQKIEYEYYTGKLYQQGDSQHWGLTVNGAETIQPKNLLKKRTSTYIENNIPQVEVVALSYAFDGDGKIISMTETEGTNNRTYNYQYQCN